MLTNIDVRLEMVAYASEVLKAAGFRHVYTSMKSEACYYSLGDRDGVIRVAAHRYSRTSDRMITAPVLACLTFGESTSPASQQALDTIIAHAVGRYVMAAGERTAKWRASAARVGNVRVTVAKERAANID